LPYPVKRIGKPKKSLRCAEVFHEKSSSNSDCGNSVEPAWQRHYPIREGESLTTALVESSLAEPHFTAAMSFYSSRHDRHYDSWTGNIHFDSALRQRMAFEPRRTGRDSRLAAAP
jgi:hypothetical protein